MKKTLATLALALAAGHAAAQDYGAMVQQGMARLDAIVRQSQQGVQQIVARRMHDPAVQAAWQQHLARSGGRPGMDYPTFAYQYIYTNGFSAAGMAHARATESGIQRREAAAWQGVRQAEAARGQAQQGLRDGYFANQQEAGRGLIGQSTYIAPDGQGLQLPHTWQPNTSHRHQGRNYHVDAGGQYWVQAGNGWWYPLQPR